MIRSLDIRVAKLEQYQSPRKSYVMRVGEPPTEAELAQIEEAAREGRRIAVLPHPARTVECPRSGHQLAQSAHQRGPGIHFPPEANCLVGLADGKAVPVIETCETVRPMMEHR